MENIFGIAGIDNGIFWMSKEKTTTTRKNICDERGKRHAQRKYITQKQQQIAHKAKAFAISSFDAIFFLFSFLLITDKQAVF